MISAAIGFIAGIFFAAYYPQPSAFMREKVLVAFNKAKEFFAKKD